MIDTDKYEGHTEGPWSFNEEYLYELFICAPALKEVNPDNITFVFNNESVDVNKQLLADAPFILQALIDERAEVKRLHEAIDNIAKGMDEDWRHWRNELEKVIE